MKIIKRAYRSRINQLKDKYKIDLNILNRYRYLFDSGSISELEYLNKQSELDQLSYSIKIIEEDMNRELTNSEKNIQELKT